MRKYNMNTDNNSMKIKGVNLGAVDEGSAEHKGIRDEVSGPDFPVVMTSRTDSSVVYKGIRAL